MGWDRIDHVPLPDIAPLVVRLGPADAGEVLTLQFAAWVREAQANATLDIPPLLETLDDVVRDLGDDRYTVWGVRAADTGRLLAMVRTSLRENRTVAFVGRLGVVPDRRGTGLGAAVLAWAEDHVPDTVREFQLDTGIHSTDNHRFYARAGYDLAPDLVGPPGTVCFRKPRVSTPR